MRFCFSELSFSFILTEKFAYPEELNMKWPLAVKGGEVWAWGACDSCAAGRHAAPMALYNFVARHYSPMTALLQPSPDPQSLPCDAG